MILFLPVFLPLLTIVLLLLVRKKLHAQQWITVMASALQFIVAVQLLLKVYADGPMVMQSGSWPAPFGITFYADLFSSIMLVTSAAIGFILVFYAIGMLDRLRKQNSFFVLLQGLFAGVNGSFLTGDIFNLYVWFEVMMISSFVLITLGGTKEQLKGSVKYVVMNILGSTFFVIAIGLIYGQTGTLNMADLALKIGDKEPGAVVGSALMLFFIAFGIKAAVFPLNFWLPASYPAAPSPVFAFFAATLTKVGVYVIIRFYALFIDFDVDFWQQIVFIIAGLTMVSGVLMAASSFDIRKILSFHIISQIGYMIMGVGIFTVTGLGGAIYFLVHNMLSKTATIMSGGLVNQMRGSYHLKNLGYIYKEKPLLAFLFLIPALSLAGIPPTPGFYGKLFLIYGGFQSGNIIITVIALLVSILTLYSMVKIWNEAFWKKTTEASVSYPVSKLAYGATIAIVSILLLFGFATFILADVFFEAAAQVMDKSFYINNVLTIATP